MSEWRPIETAPHRKEILVGAWIEGVWNYSVYSITSKFWREDWDTTEEEPTHWTELPSPPKPSFDDVV